MNDPVTLFRPLDADKANYLAKLRDKLPRSVSLKVMNDVGPNDDNFRAFYQVMSNGEIVAEVPIRSQREGEAKALAEWIAASINFQQEVTYGLSRPVPSLA